MAKQLSEAAIQRILNDIDLSATVAKILGLKKITGLYDALKRNGNNVNRLDRIEAIAKAMNLKQDAILEEKEFAKAV